MAQIICGNRLLLSQSALRRLGMRAKDIADLGAPDAVEPNPPGYAHPIRMYDHHRIVLALPSDVEICEGCGYARKDGCAPCVDRALGLRGFLK
jgi:hypothetical protein